MQKPCTYHLHVVYVPVVEKQILWPKRCKDKALVGTVKEAVMQVSRSKKWASKPLLNDAGEPVLQKNGKPVLKKSYSVLQDDFFHYMRNAGYIKQENPSPQAVPAAGEPTIFMTALLELLKNADPEVKAQLRLALLT